MPRLILGIIGIIAAGAIFFLYTRTTYDSVQVTRAQIAEYDTALDKATELQQVKQTLLSRFNALDQNALDRLKKLLPDHVDNISLILEIDNLAGKYGMALANVDISSSQADSSTSVGSVGSVNQGQDSLTMKFSTEGTYDDFLQFLTDLESSLRIVDLVSLSLAPSALSSPTPVYRYGITLRTYWLR